MENPVSGPVVWVSRAPMDSTLIEPFDSEYWDSDRDKDADLFKRNAKGEATDSDTMPRAFFATRSPRSLSKLPNIFYAGGYWLFRKELVELVQEFDLGRTKFFPTSLYREDKTTEIDGVFYCASFRETKDCFLPYESGRTKKPWKSLDIWTLQPPPKDFDLTLSSASLQGVDLWIDKRVDRAFFLSDDLARSLQNSKLRMNWGLFKCQVAST